MTALTDQMRRELTAQATVCRCGRRIYEHGRRVVPNAGVKEYVCNLTESGRFESRTLPAVSYDPDEGLLLHAGAS